MSDVIVNKDSATVDKSEEIERPTPKASYDTVYRYALVFCKGDATKATSFCRGWFSVGRDDLTTIISNEEKQNDRTKSSSIKRKSKHTKINQE
jgi:sarcosine oxidase delta subunit